MKIIQIISGLGNGGAEKFVVELSNQLSRDHEVLLCSFKPVHDQMVFPKLLKKEVGLRSFGKAKGFSPGIYKKMWDLIRSERPDVVHFHLDSTIKYILPLVLCFSKIKFVHTIHNNLNIHKKKVFKHLARLPFISNRVSWVCIAPVICNDFRCAYPNLRFHMVQNGMAEFKTTPLLEEIKKEINLIKPTSGTTVLVAVAKLSPTKNQEMLMDVMRELKEKDIVAVVIGHDASVDQNYLKRLTAMNTGNVFLVGAKSNVADYLACSNAFVITSLHEGLPISALEAFSFGLPVIATPAGGVVDLVEHKINGFVTSDFTKEAFLKAMNKYMMLDETEKKRIGEENRRKYVSQYSMATCAENYQKLYRMN